VEEGWKDDDSNDGGVVAWDSDKGTLPFSALGQSILSHNQNLDTSLIPSAYTQRVTSPLGGNPSLASWRRL